MRSRFVATRKERVSTPFFIDYRSLLHNYYNLEAVIRVSVVKALSVIVVVVIVVVVVVPGRAVSRVNSCLLLELQSLSGCIGIRVDHPVCSLLV